MGVLFLEYPKCSTCKKAKKWLEDNSVEFTDRHIKEENPTAEELSEWHKKAGPAFKEILQYGAEYCIRSLSLRIKFK